jgi:hypothetical protein
VWRNKQNAVKWKGKQINEGKARIAVRLWRLSSPRRSICRAHCSAATFLSRNRSWYRPPSCKDRTPYQSSANNWPQPLITHAKKGWDKIDLTPHEKFLVYRQKWLVIALQLVRAGGCALQTARNSVPTHPAERCGLAYRPSPSAIRGTKQCVSPTYMVKKAYSLQAKDITDTGTEGAS